MTLETHSGLITTLLSFTCPHVYGVNTFQLHNASNIMHNFKVSDINLLRNLYQFKLFTCHKQADTMTVIQKRQSLTV